jgi:hypothetical protein
MGCPHYEDRDYNWCMYNKGKFDGRMEKNKRCLTSFNLENLEEKVSSSLVPPSRFVNEYYENGYLNGLHSPRTI